MATLRVRDRIEFKFQYIQNRQAVGRKLMGVADESGLLLGTNRFSPSAILSVVRCSKARLVISYVGDAVPPQIQLNQVAIGVYGDLASQLKLYLDRVLSTSRLAAIREALQRFDKSDTFRSTDCPHCGCSVNLSGLASSAYVYCPYCQSIFTGQETVSCGDEHQICPKCRQFARLNFLNEWYVFGFYPLIGFYRWEQHWICWRCAARLKILMTLFNTLFLVPLIPNLIWQLFKVHWRPSAEDRAFGRQGSAIRRGRLAKLDQLYQSIYARWPDHPGLLYNEIMAALKAGDKPGAYSRAQRVLAACPNFEPALKLIRDNEIVTLKQPTLITTVMMK